MPKLSDKAGFLIAANFFKYAVGFVLPMVLVRLLAKEDYGSYQQLLLIGTTAGTIMVAGLPTSIYYFYHHIAAPRRPTLIAQTSCLLAAFAALTALAAWLLSGSIALRFHNPALTILMPAYACYLLFFVAGEHFVPLLITQDRYSTLVGFEIVETVLRAALLLTPALLGWGLGGVVAGTAVFAALRYAVRSTSLFFGYERLDAQALRESFARMQLGYGIPIALTALAGTIGGVFNRAIVAMYFSPAQYAVYAVGALELPLDTIFQASVFNVLRASLPPLVRDGRPEEVLRILREAVRKLALVMLPSFVFLLGFASQFITTLFTQSYAESVDIFRIYVFLIPLNMFVLSPIPQIFGRPRINLYIVIASAMVMVALGWVLLRAIGFYGPAIAIVAVQYLQTALFLGAAVRLLRAPLPRLLPLAALGRIALACGAALAAAQLIADLTRSPLLNLLFDVVSFSLVYAATALVLGAFTVGDRELARRWLSRLCLRSLR